MKLASLPATSWSNLFMKADGERSPKVSASGTRAALPLREAVDADESVLESGVGGVGWSGNDVFDMAGSGAVQSSDNLLETHPVDSDSAQFELGVSLCEPEAWTNTQERRKLEGNGMGGCRCGGVCHVGSCVCSWLGSPVWRVSTSVVYIERKQSCCIRVYMTSEHNYGPYGRALQSFDRLSA